MAELRTKTEARDADFRALIRNTPSGGGGAGDRAAADAKARRRTTPWGSSGKKTPEKKVHMVRPMTQEDVDRLTAKNAVILAKMAEEKLAARVKQGDAIREAYRARKAARPKLGQELGQAVGLVSVGVGLFRSNKRGAK